MTFKQAVAGLLASTFLAAVFAQAPPPKPAAETSSPAAVKYASGFYLAYVRSPNDRVNRLTQEGLAALGGELLKRTTIKPRGVEALNIESDDISLLSFLYWPVTPDSQALSDQARRKVQNFIDTGGVILFDLHDPAANLRSSPAVKRVLEGLAVKPLAALDADHALTRSFYLLKGLPGSNAYNAVWVEAPAAIGVESVSVVNIGENNWAGAWAGRTTAPGSREREMAVRAGINIVSYALTGNYKKDQVHVPEIMKKLGR